MLLYRVFPWLDRAGQGEPGHALHVAERQGAGRVDNPDLYRVLYVSSAPAAAVAERFGTLTPWTPRMFLTPELPGSRKALATYELDDGVTVFDLDDTRALQELGLRPSQVVTRERAVTQRWAREIFSRRRAAGVRWWSYYDPRWYAYALWERTGLRVRSVEPLDLDHPAVREAAEVLRRPRRTRS